MIGQDFFLSKKVQGDYKGGNGKGQRTRTQKGELATSGEELAVLEQLGNLGDSPAIDATQQRRVSLGSCTYNHVFMCVFISVFNTLWYIHMHAVSCQNSTVHTDTDDVVHSLPD